jgi:glycosyltransferase involved in cell wall biosynthesis
MEFPQSELRAREHSPSGSLRVLLVLHQFFPYTHFGTERYALELARGLKAFGHEVTVLSVAPRAASGKVTAAVSRYSYEGVSVVALNGFLRANVDFSETFARWDLDDLWREVLWEVQPDVIHACHLLQHTPEFLRVARETGVPLVLTLTDFWGLCWGGQLVQGRTQRQCDGPDRFAYNCVADRVSTLDAPTRSPLLNRILTSLRDTPLHDPAANALRLVPKSFRKRIAPEVEAARWRSRHVRARYELADAWIAPSQYLLDRYAEAGFARERFHLIPYGVTAPTDAELRALDDRFADRDASGGVRFGYMGQLAAHKGVHELIRAFREAAPSSATLAIHGGLDTYRGYAVELEGLAAGDPRIRFEGSYPTDDVYRVLSTIDVLVVSSLWHENAPYVLLTALESRTPVVVPRAHGMIEFVKPGVDGLVYEMGDRAGLRRLISELARDQSLVCDLAKRRERYGFGSVDVTRATLAVYEQARSAGRPVDFRPPPDRIDPTMERLLTGDVIPPCNASGILEILSLSRARRYEVSIPRDDPAAQRSPAWGRGPWGRRLRRSAARWFHGPPPPPSPHAHSHATLFSYAGEGIQLDRHPAFAGSDRIEIVARQNRGNASSLEFEFTDEHGTSVRGELRFSWPKDTFSRVVVPLETRGGRRLTALTWTPCRPDGRTPLKLNLLSIGFCSRARSSRPVAREDMVTSGASSPWTSASSFRP